ncbi:MAG: hypothetical protein COV59_01610 [Candidatus Magasanikbacteria bacterium CG11_big_fil_rev_8_21_14_0_20_39_34]|uniref:Transcription regulator TrmB N-terminal domain-containing protein n=1 Tax=Candidatus Magasanikbacteria bacterium CG11_big_fil_rev_8_21_14_0_20_39_34 TaxID=1974653 RepID=A0A2H0N5Z9_9BACT|nr:MAG: hypothetical protein COV59_01610 [Candidatus Magasanikbacteria bacterium CG11_big_fil_rev_8_21_14_0_20_39_34]
MKEFQKYHKVISQLQKTGLSEKEAWVYSALYDLGGAYPSKVAEYSGLNRSTVYALLERLCIKGLVTELEKKKKIFYQLENPQKLIRYAQGRVRMANEGVDQAQKLIPELEGLFSLTPNKPKVIFYEGKDEIIQVYDDHIAGKKNYEMYGFSNVENLISFLPKGYLREYVKKKEKYGITSKGIVPNTKISSDYAKNEYRHVGKKIWPQLRFIEKNSFPFSAELTVYDRNRVSMVNFDARGLIGVIIEDSTIHGMMKMLFELAWNGISLSIRK